MITKLLQNPVSRGHSDKMVWEGSQQGRVYYSSHFHIRTEEKQPYIHIENSGQAVFNVWWPTVDGLPMWGTSQRACCVIFSAHL